MSQRKALVDPETDRVENIIIAQDGYEHPEYDVLSVDKTIRGDGPPVAPGYEFDRDNDEFVPGEPPEPPTSPLDELRDDVDKTRRDLDTLQGDQPVRRGRVSSETVDRIKTAVDDVDDEAAADAIRELTHVLTGDDRFERDG